MKIIDDYKEVKRNHAAFFKKFKPKQRIKHKDQVISLKREIDQFESQIINGLLNYRFNYSMVFDLLKKSSDHQFLKEDDRIKKFLLDSSIKESIGFDQKNRHDILKEFEDLCNEVWKDYIITDEEREELNEFCLDNKIDRTQQFLVERKVASKYSTDFDINKIINHYYTSENYDINEIKNVLSKEYKIEADLERIKIVTSQIDSKLTEDEDPVEGSSVLLKTLSFNSNKKVYVIVVDKITSPYDFELSFKSDESNSFKVFLEKKTIDNNDENRIIDIITDAICYNLTTESSSTTEFCSLKPKVRENIIAQFIS
jgi:hypothetical protein